MEELEGNNISSEKYQELEELKAEVLRLSEELEEYKESQDLLDQISEEGYFLHENLTIKKSNLALAKLTGYELSEMIGKSPKLFLATDSYRIFSQENKPELSKPVEVELIRKDGSTVKAWLKHTFYDVEGVRIRAAIIQKFFEIGGIQAELNDSVEKNRALSETTNEALLFSREGVCVEANNSATKMFGYTHEELLGISCTEIIAEESKQFVKQSILSETELPFEVMVRHKDGHTFFAEFERKKCTYKEKEVSVTSVRDITRRKTAEQALVESDERNRQISGMLSDYVYSCKIIPNQAPVIGWTSGALEKICGYSTSEIEALDQGWFSIVHPEDVKKVANSIYINYSEDKIYENQYRIIDKSGKLKWMLDKSMCIGTNESTKEVTLIGATKDITEQKIAEEALQSAANIFNNIQVGLFIFHLEDPEDDLSLRLVTINPAAAQISGAPAKKMIGKTIDENFPNLRKGNVPHQYAEVVRTQKPIELEDIYYGDENIEYAAFSVKVFPLPNQCVGVSVENVSARRKAEKELRTRNDELNNFVYRVSHDLKAPLSSIKGLINLTRIEGNRHDHMPMIEERINRLDGFIRDILSHSRNLNTAVIIEKLDLEDIMNYCFNELDYLPNSNTIKKVIHKSGVEFFNDKIRLTEIYRNLVSNSIKYQDPKKKDNFVHVNMQVTPKFATIIFEDNGIGIASDYHKNIFKMFYRATESSEGSGIGLYIVKQAIEKLGGEIDLESEQGTGSKFILKLPNLAPKEK